MLSKHSTTELHPKSSASVFNCPLPQNGKRTVVRRKKFHVVLEAFCMLDETSGLVLAFVCASVL